KLPASTGRSRRSRKTFLTKSLSEQPSDWARIRLGSEPISRAISTLAIAIGGLSLMSGGPLAKGVLDGSWTAFSKHAPCQRVDVRVVVGEDRRAAGRREIHDRRSRGSSERRHRRLRGRGAKTVSHVGDRPGGREREHRVGALAVPRVDHDRWEHPPEGGAGRQQELARTTDVEDVQREHPVDREVSSRELEELDRREVEGNVRSPLVE